VGFVEVEHLGATPMATSGKTRGALFRALREASSH